MLATQLEAAVSEPVSSPPGEADIPAAGLDALAGELFAALDAEEDARAASH